MRAGRGPKPRRRQGGALPASASTRRNLSLSAELGVEGLRKALAEQGCPNVVDRASELALTGRTRFYRGGDDPAVVDVALEEAAESGGGS